MFRSVATEVQPSFVAAVPLDHDLNLTFGLEVRHFMSETKSFTRESAETKRLLSDDSLEPRDSSGHSF